MIDNDIKRNGSGYYDETPVKSGVLNGPQPGEIWSTTLGKEMLILKNHGGYCNTLALRDSTTHADNIEVISKEVRYVNPVMIGYLANKEMCQFIKAVPEEKYLEVMEAIGERLGVTIKVSRDNNASEPDKRDVYIKHLERACLGFEGQMEDAKRELQECREEMALRRDFREEYEKAEAKATLWEKMYNALLDRLLARGEAK